MSIISVFLFLMRKHDRTFLPTPPAALTSACMQGRTEIVKFLLKRGASVNKMNQSQMTPLICAVRKGHWEIVDILLFHSASLVDVDRHGRTPLMLAAGEGHLAVLEILLSKGNTCLRDALFCGPKWPPVGQAPCLYHFSTMKFFPKFCQLFRDLGLWWSRCSSFGSPKGTVLFRPLLPPATGLRSTLASAQQD